MAVSEPTLEIINLTVAYRQGSTWPEAVREFSLEIVAGQTYGLVGESGSGKSTVALAIMRHLGQYGRVLGGEINFLGRNLLQLSSAEMRKVWGEQMAMVPQDPLSSLNPSLPVGEQIAEILRQHLRLNRAEARQRSIELLRIVRVPDPERVERSYPHEISGGMQQRVLIAMALSTEPQLLVLDEPTTGLDVTTQAAILDLFRDLIEERETAALYVTHNLGVVARICHRVAVLYAGELVEDATVTDLFHKPWHPYTEGLLESVPQIRQSKSHVELQAIPGQIPSLMNRPHGCVFADRCAVALERCHSERPSLEMPVAGRRVRCFRWPEIAAGKISARSEATAINRSQGNNGLSSILLAVDDLEVYFDVNRSLTDSIRRRPGQVVKAVDGVNLSLERGQTLGVVGESGSGKTTLARAVVGLAARTGGEIDLLGLNLAPSLQKRPRETRRRLQYVFQNPEEALNPYMTVGETLRRPFITLLGSTREDADAAVAKLLDMVRLPVDYVNRLPGQLSGGEKQRVAIARAFATAPDLLIADEPVSALDVSVQASILNLLRELQTKHNNTLIFISHDLAVVGYLADLVAVMYVGHIMELATAESLFQPPFHPYTEALLSSIPVLDPTVEQDRIHLEGDVASQIDLPSGCPFHARCPRYIGDLCRTQTPPWRQTKGGDQVYCHIPLAELERDQSGSGSQ